MDFKFIGFPEFIYWKTLKQMQQTFLATTTERLDFIQTTFGQTIFQISSYEEDVGLYIYYDWPILVSLADSASVQEG